MSVFSGYNLLRPITAFLANSTRLKTPYLTFLSSTSLFTIILFAKYIIVLFLEKEKAKKYIKEINNFIT